MDRVNIRGLSRAFPIVVALAMMTGSAPVAAGQEPTYPPDGTWLAVATRPNGVKTPFMDTYASFPNEHASNGTVVCTLPQGRFMLPLGPGGAPISVTGTQTGQGTWTRVEKNVYAFTAWRILTDPDGNAVGWVKFWGSIRPDAPDHFFGEINAGFYTLDFVPLPMPPALPTQTEGRRVAVDTQ